MQLRIEGEIWVRTSWSAVVVVVFVCVDLARFDIVVDILDSVVVLEPVSGTSLTWRFRVLSFSMFVFFSSYLNV